MTVAEASSGARLAVGRTPWAGSIPILRRRRDVAQSGSAPALGAGGRGFESRRPDFMGAPIEARVKRLTLIACIMGSGIALLDGTVVNVALPTIQRHLGGGLAAQQWVLNGYLLTLGSLILVGGSLGDLYG